MTPAAVAERIVAEKRPYVFTAECAADLVEHWLSRGESRTEIHDALIDKINEIVAAAIKAEREECAKVAEGYRLHEPDRVCCMGRNERIAAAIRART